MKLYWNILNGKITDRFNYDEPPLQTKLVRSASTLIEVVPLEDTKTASMDDVIMGFILKVTNQYNSDGVALVLPLLYDEERKAYTGRINLITTALNEMLGVDGTAKPSVNVMGGFGYLLDNEYWISSESFPVTVLNNPFRGTESHPEPPPANDLFHIYTALVGDDNSVESIDTIGKDKIVAFAVVDGKLSVWNLIIGTQETDVEAGFIRPHDYNEEFNPKVFIQVS